MIKHAHPNHYTLGEVRVAHGKEYALVEINGRTSGALVAELCADKDGGLCAGCPHRRTTDCTDASLPSRQPICNPPNGTTPAGTTVVVPLSIVPLLALHGALS